MNYIHTLILTLLQNINNPVYLEVGCHQGTDLQIAIDNFPNGLFWAIEPLPSNFQKMVQNIRPPKNNINGVRMDQLAISNVIGEADFYCSDDPEHFRGSSSLNRPTGHLQVFDHVKFPEVIKVKTTTLDKYCLDNKISHIDYCWVDIQSGEANLIKGAQKILKNCRYLQIEYYINTSLYEGQKSLEEMISMLPGHWRIVEKLDHDCVLENLDFNK